MSTKYAPVGTLARPMWITGPSVSFTTAVTQATISVTVPPKKLTTACSRQPACLSLKCLMPIPICESVNVMKTPTAYNGISALVSPPKT